jgi:hypothetical protein
LPLPNFRLIAFIERICTKDCIAGKIRQTRKQGHSTGCEHVKSIDPLPVRQNSESGIENKAGTCHAGAYQKCCSDFMISNERPSPFGRRPNAQPRPPVKEDTLKSEQVQIERKTFVLTLKENPRGRFLRITEDGGGHRDTIIIPSTGLEEFKKLFNEMVKVSNEMPPNHA